MPVMLTVGTTRLRFNYETEDAALFLALGAAVAEVQALEFHLVHLIGMATAKADGKTHSEVIEEFFQKTLGTLARTLRGEVGDPSLAAELDEVVRKRNHLIHAFLRTCEWPMLSPEAYVQAVKELDGTARFFRESGDKITIAVRKAKDLQILLLRTNPITGLPEVT